MTKHIIYYLCVAFATVACSRYPKDVERALKLSGDNRAELEKVLEHYRKRPEDKLKLKSAYFLIANMPYHYTVQDARLDSFKVYLKKNEPREGFLNHYKKTYGPITGKEEIKSDLFHVTSEYLIRNIDFSFQVWQEMPWGKNISFDVFCKEILPYRLSHEPLEFWKEAYIDFFRPIIDTMAHNNQLELICLKLLYHTLEQGWVYDRNLPDHGLGASILLAKRYGGCKEQAEFIAYMLRSIGIPSGIDIFIQKANGTQQRHFWNYVCDSNGNNIGFELEGITPLEDGGRLTFFKYGKIYRQCYALQKESLPVKYAKNYIPPGSLRDVLLSDVSFLYFPDTHISIRSDPSDLFGEKDLAYLCVFNGKDWIPISWCKPQKGMAVFRNVEPGILYQLRLIDKSQDVAASKPFIFLNNVNLQFLDADTTVFQSMTLIRKFRFPYPSWPRYVTRSVNGKFQGANQPDFSDSITLHTIRKVADFSYVDIKPEHSGKFKYVRYLSANGGYNNMAEIQFYSDGKRLHGEVIGTDGSKDIFPNSTKYSVFDDDPLTFFDAVEADGAWAGLELGKAYRIDAIRYLFRNDDNNIRPGDTYELFYLNNRQWISAGTQTADTLLLQYENVPAHTLYWLRNHTRGKEERPFTYEDGKQIFW